MSKKNIGVIIIFLSLCLMAVGATVLLSGKEKVIEKEKEPTKEEIKEENVKNQIEKVFIVPKGYKFLTNDDKSYSLRDIENNFSTNKDELFFDYIQVAENQDFYMEHLMNLLSHSTYDEQKVYEEISSLLSKKPEELTLDEKVQIDNYFARSNKGVYDVFELNQFLLKTNVYEEISKYDIEKQNLLMKNKNTSYMKNSMEDNEEDMLLFLLVAKYYEDDMNSLYKPLTDAQKAEYNENINVLSFDELSHLFYDNYHLLKSKYNEVATYKYQDAFVSEAVMKQTFDKHNYQSLEDEYELLKDKADIKVGSYEFFVITEYAKVKVFTSSEEEVASFKEEIYDKPFNSYTFYDTSLLYAIHDYQSHDESGNDSHMEELDMRYKN